MSFHKTTVTRKGQITIPADLRRELGIEIGDQIAVERDGKGLHIEKHSPLSIVEELAGSLNAYVTYSGLTGDEVIAMQKEAFAQAIVDDYLETERRIRPDDDAT